MRKVVIGLSLAILGLVALVFFGVFTPSTPVAPSAWHSVHVGMSRSKILQLAGPSPNSFFPEKIREAWDRDGILGIRKLEVVYGSEPGDQTARYVREYVYWRPCRRYIITRSEP